MNRSTRRALISFLLSAGVVAAALLLNLLFPDLVSLRGPLPLLVLAAVIAGIWCAATVLMLGTMWLLQNRGRPEAEAVMISRLYRLASILVIILTLAYGYGKLGTFGTLFSLFGGMVLGWSLQAPVSGFAAWVLVSLKRPFRPGDRIQFPNLGLTGDVVDIGAMYVVLDQVGGTVGSEEAVGRNILVPNAMLFSQVVINFTVCQEAAYMLDEVVVRITYDSDMDVAERILLNAAQEITGDIIAATGVQPYIRSDLYDYGLYLRLRFQTQVKSRARIAYEINKRILQDVQQTPSVDLAIPFVYSYRAGADRKEEDSPSGQGTRALRNIEIAQIRPPTGNDLREVDQIAQRITTEGLLQPIIVRPRGDGSSYDIIAGHLRFEACKRLGWKTIPAVVQSQQSPGPSAAGQPAPAAGPAGPTDPLMVVVKPSRQGDGIRGKDLPPSP